MEFLRTKPLSLLVLRHFTLFYTSLLAKQSLPLPLRIINAMMNFGALLTVLCGICHHSSAVIAFNLQSTLQESRRSSLLHLVDDERRIDNSNQDDLLISTKRRVLFQSVTTLLTTATVTTVLHPSAAGAESDLFKPNPLTNKGLEQLRIWNQDEADNIKYGGELDSGSNKPGAFETYVDLLQPILGVQSDLATINQLVDSKIGSSTTKEDYVAVFQEIKRILSQGIFDKIQFKKAFNAFADNIYYSDPDRANLYLGGGAVPQSTQTLAYLLRNDVLTNVEDMRAETQYLLKELNKKKDGETVVVGGDGLDLEEIQKLSKAANEAMVKYLALVPPKELESARSKFTAKR